VVPLYEVDANMCWTLLFQDKNEISPWEADPVLCTIIIYTKYVKFINLQRQIFED